MIRKGNQRNDNSVGCGVLQSGFRAGYADNALDNRRVSASGAGLNKDLPS